MKTKLALFLLWAASLCVAFYIGKTRQPSPPETLAVNAAKGAPHIEETPAETPVDEPRRLPGPVKLSLLEMLYSDDTGSFFYQYGLLLEGLDADTLPLFLEEVEALPSTPRKLEFLASLMARWGELDPLAAGNYLKTVPGKLQGRLIASMAESWAKTDPQAAWEYVMAESKNGRKTHIGLHTVFKSAFQTNPHLALSLVDQMDNERYRGHLFSRLGAYAAEKGNFQETISAIASLQPSEDKDAALIGMWREWTAADPEGAMRYYASMEPGPGKDAALEPLMYGWATKDPQAALNYYLEKMDVENRGAVLKAVIRGWAETGRLMEAASYLLELPVSKETDEAVNGILFQMEQEDPETAMGWASSLQNEDRRKSAVRSALYNWAQEDPESAQAYVMEMPAGEDRDNNIQSLVSAQSHEGAIPENLVPLIEQIEDTDKRERTVISLAERAVRGFSFAPNVSEENKTQLIGQIKGMEGISDEIRTRAISLISGDPPEG